VYTKQSRTTDSTVHQSQHCTLSEPCVSQAQLSTATHNNPRTASLAFPELSTATHNNACTASLAFPELGTATYTTAHNQPWMSHANTLQAQHSTASLALDCGHSTKHSTASRYTAGTAQHSLALRPCWCVNLLWRGWETRSERFRPRFSGPVRVSVMCLGVRTLWVWCACVCVKLWIFISFLASSLFINIYLLTYISIFFSWSTCLLTTFASAL
jgi:hypothetical protein